MRPFFSPAIELCILAVALPLGARSGMSVARGPDVSLIFMFRGAAHPFERSRLVQLFDGAADGPSTSGRAIVNYRSDHDARLSRSLSFSLSLFRQRRFFKGPPLCLKSRFPVKRLCGFTTGLPHHFVERLKDTGAASISIKYKHIQRKQVLNWP